jgi:hypothetical protein
MCLLSTNLFLFIMYKTQSVVIIQNFKIALTS